MPVSKENKCGSPYLPSWPSALAEAPVAPSLPVTCCCLLSKMLDALK